MNTFQNKSSALREKKCPVCDSELDPGAALRELKDICKDVQCQHLYKQRLTMRPEVYKPHFAFQQKLIKSKKFREKATAEHKARIEAAELEDNRHIELKIIAQEQTLKNKKISVVMIPTGLSEMIVPGADRIEEYRRHLNQVISEAIAAEEVDAIPVDQHVVAQERLHKQDAFFETYPVIREQSDLICTLCKGGCCSSGGNHAFISAITIRRQLDKDPELNAQTIADSYINHLPAGSINGACINQTDQGCALPRELRSDVCNVYFCDELQTLHKTLEADSLPSESAAIIIQRSNHNWNRYETPDINPVRSIHLVEEGRSVELENPQRYTKARSITSTDN